MQIRFIFFQRIEFTDIFDELVVKLRQSLVVILLILTLKTTGWPAKLFSDTLPGMKARDRSRAGFFADQTSSKPGMKVLEPIFKS